MKFKSKKKLKQISVMLSLLVMSDKNINSEELNNLLGNINTEVYQEIGNPEYGSYLYETYQELPEYLKLFLENNLMRIIVLENEDDVEKIYQSLYNNQTNVQNVSSLVIVNKLLAFIEGCSNDEKLQNSDLLREGYTIEDLNKLNLRFIMFHQIGHLIDAHYNIMNMRLFASIYIQEQEQFVRLQNNYVNNDFIQYKINSSEYFASAYAYYILYPKKLIKYCPKTFYFVNDIVKEMIKENDKKIK